MPIMPPPLFSIPLPLIILLSCIHATYSAARSESCAAASSSCGNITVDYPFALYDPYSSTGDATTYCGYPGLQIYCYDQSNPLLILGANNYTVTNVSYVARTISLVDTDILLQSYHSTSAPTIDHNVSIARTWLNYTDLVINITFFLNCPSPLGATFANGSFAPGNSKPGKYSYVFPTAEIPHEYSSQWAKVCEEVVVAPALGPIVNDQVLNLSSAYDMVLLQGFQLEWRDESDSEYCTKCESRGGDCGYNVTGGNYLSYNLTCFSTGKKGHTAVVIGVSVAAVAFFLLFSICAVLYIRKKRQHSPRAVLLKQSRSLSSLGPSYMHSRDLSDIESTQITHVFTYQELEEATNGFDTEEEIGDGGFGTVYKGKLRDGRIVAIKRLYEHNCRRMEHFLNEVRILSCLRHPNLVALYGCTSRHSRELLLVYEFIPNGTVADHLHGSRADEKVLNWHRRLAIAIEAADALAYLHAVDPPIVHRDVKTSNMLVDAGFHVKVADFGLSRLFPTAVTHVSTAPQGTPGYVDPEYHKCYQLTDKSDVYSFGVVLVEFISSMPAVDVTRHRDEINLASMAIKLIQRCELDKLVDPSLGFGSDRAIKRMITMVAELAFRCLQPDGDMRPPIKEVLEVLLEIQKEGTNLQRINGAPEKEVRAEDNKGLLKNSTVAPSSPDSVINKWTSTTTTPNASE